MHRISRRRVTKNSNKTADLDNDDSTLSLPSSVPSSSSSLKRKRVAADRANKKELSSDSSSCRKKEKEKEKESGPGDQRDGIGEEPAKKKRRFGEELHEKVAQIETQLSSLTELANNHCIAHYLSDIINHFSRLSGEAKHRLDELSNLDGFLKQHMGTACSNVSSSYFSVLPPEINIHILSFLDAKELLEVALVNKEWNRLALDEALWRRLCDRRWKELREGRRLKFSKHKRQKMVPLKRSESWKDVFAHRTRVDKNWSTGNYSRVVTLRGHEGQVCCCQYDEEKIVSGSFDSSIKVWDIRNLDTEEEVSAVMTLKKKETNAAHTDRVLCLMFEDNTLVTGGRDETIKIWDLETGTCVNTLSGHSDNVWYLQFDHEKIISGSADKTIRHWDIRTGKCYKTLIGHDRGLSCLHFENEENLLMSGSADQTIRLWDLRTDQCRQILEGHEEAVYCLYYYNRKLISGGEDKTARIWDIDSGKCTSTISDETCKDKHTGAIYCMQFDDARLVTGSFDHTIKVWDMNTEECLCTLGKDLGDEDDFHTNTVRCIQFDDHKMVSASADRTIKLWDMR